MRTAVKDASSRGAKKLKEKKGAEGMEMWETQEGTLITPQESMNSTKYTAKLTIHTK